MFALQVAYGQPIDYIIVIVYFVVVLGFGALFGKGNKTTKDFFLSGQRFSWWLIAFSCIATVVGSYSFIKYSAAGFRYGLSSSMSYLNDWFLVPLFMLGWMPIIYFSRVTSIPEYFEKRFNRPVRIVAVLLILVYLVGYIGINLYTLGVALSAIVPALGVFEWSIIIAVVTAFYVTFGGQTAVIMTDLLQGFLLLAAGILLFVLGIRYLGTHNPEGLTGLQAFWKGLPPEHRMPFSGMAHPDKFPMVGVFWQDVFGSSMFFYFANQGLIMRFLAVKSVHEGRKAITLVVLFLMPVAMLAVGNAGWLGSALSYFGLIPKNSSANQIFMTVTETITMPGVFGLILAALTAALMSTVDTLINAVSAIWVNDVYKLFIAKDKTDKHYLKSARVASIVFTVAGLLLVPVFMQFNSIYVAHATFTAAIAPPMIVVVILGVLWKRFSPWAAFWTLTLGGFFVILSLIWPGMVEPLGRLHGMDGANSINYMRALYGLLVCLFAGVAFTFIFPAPKGYEERIKGMWAGTLHWAKENYKGGTPNDARLGRKQRLNLRSADPSEVELGERSVAVVGPVAAKALEVNEGDFAYIADKRWWLGGLRSVHVKIAISPDAEGSVLVASNHIEHGGLRPGEAVVVEKII